MAAGIVVRRLGPDDLAHVLALFDAALAWQAQAGRGRWAGIDASAIATDLAAHRVFAMEDEHGEALVFTLLEADPAIWGEREMGDALYLHRVVVRPERRGERRFPALVKWAEAEARRRGRTRLRLDTWLEAEGLQAYYAACGFARVGELTTPDDPRLPVQNRNLAVALMERPVIGLDMIS